MPPLTTKDQVQEASNAMEALSLIETHDAFDLVITDVIMPQMSGKELYDRLQLQGCDARVLFISGYTDNALAHHGVLDAELSFLEKPFSPARLARKVREVLDGGRAPEAALLEHRVASSISDSSSRKSLFEKVGL